MDFSVLGNGHTYKGVDEGVCCAGEGCCGGEVCCTTGMRIIALTCLLAAAVLGLTLGNSPSPPDADPLAVPPPSTTRSYLETPTPSKFWEPSFTPTGLPTLEGMCLSGSVLNLPESVMFFTPMWRCLPS